MTTERTSESTPAQALKVATQDWHNKLEQVSKSDRIMNGSLTQPELKQMMAAHFRLHQRLEPELLRILGAAPKLDYPDRLKLNALKQDLQQLDVSIPPAEPVVQLEGLPQALGYAYVLEGSSLGGSVIQRQLSKTPETRDFDSDFYRFYGDQLGPKWREFIDFVNHNLQTEESLQQACAAACDAFELAHQVFADTLDAE